MMTEQRAAQRLLSSNAAAVLLRGDPAVRTLAMDLAAATIMAEGTVLWIEAANQFDLYAFAEAAKRWGDPPETLLSGSALRARSRFTNWARSPRTGWSARCASVPTRSPSCRSRWR